MKQKLPFNIIYEDNDIIVVYKQRNMFSVATQDKKTYLHNLFYHVNKYLCNKEQKAYVVHRLDYETSGLIIFAKNVFVQSDLKKEFENRNVTRLYEAVVRENMDLNFNEEVNIKIDDSLKKPIISENGKESITYIKASNYIQIGTALKISIKTGRHNQIRLSLSSLNLTLIGDKRYSNDIDKRLYLNSYYLKFDDRLPLQKTEFFIKPLWLTQEKESFTTI